MIVENSPISSSSMAVAAAVTGTPLEIAVTSPPISRCG